MTASEVLPAAPHNPTISFDGVDVDLTAVAGSDTEWEASYTIPIIRLSVKALFLLF